MAERKVSTMALSISVHRSTLHPVGGNSRSALLVCFISLGAFHADDRLDSTRVGLEGKRSSCNGWKQAIDCRIAFTPTIGLDRFVRHSRFVRVNASIERNRWIYHMLHGNECEVHNSNEVGEKLPVETETYRKQLSPRG